MALYSTFELKIERNIKSSDYNVDYLLHVTQCLLKQLYIDKMYR